MKQRVFLELLIAARGLAVAFRWIDHATAGDALRLVGKVGNPPERGERHDAQEATDQTVIEAT